MIDTILNFVFPVSCVVCRSVVTDRKWAAACPDCWSRLVAITPPFCERCGMPAIAIDGPCGLCRTDANLFDFARSALFFTDTAREIVHHLKYLDRVSLAKPLGEMLRDVYRDEGFTADAIVPVPLHPARERERGFNQAERIARHIGPPVFRDWVRRKRKTATQTGLTRAQRKHNLSGAFAVVRNVSGRRILIVDDVLTTGSTVNEIAKVLKRSGAERVEVLTVARVPNDIQPANADTTAESTLDNGISSVRSQ